MKTTRMTTAQALVKFLDNQYVEFDGKETKFVDGIFTIFGHGIVVGLGQALDEDPGSLKVYQGNARRVVLECVRECPPEALPISFCQIVCAEVHIEIRTFRLLLSHILCKRYRFIKIPYHPVIHRQGELSCASYVL